MMLRRLGLVLASLVALTGAAVAQDRAAGDFDFYVLSLSWSPAYCDSAGDRRGSTQCNPGRHLGFVTHGLWPQNEHGFPSRCGNGGPPRPALDAARDIYPDEGLARHEWQVHGTCSGLPAAEYFKAVAAARAKVEIPEPLRTIAADARTTPQNIERAFSEANPGLRADMMAVTCRRGALQEVRICLTRDLRGFRSCPEVDRDACRFGPIRVLAPR